MVIIGIYGKPILLLSHTSKNTKRKCGCVNYTTPTSIEKLTLEDFLQTSAIETLNGIKTYSEDRELSDSLSNSQNEVNTEIKTI